MASERDPKSIRASGAGGLLRCPSELSWSGLLPHQLPALTLPWTPLGRSLGKQLLASGPAGVTGRVPRVTTQEVVETVPGLWCPAQGLASGVVAGELSQDPSVYPCTCTPQQRGTRVGQAEVT